MKHLSYSSSYFSLQNEEQFIQGSVSEDPGWHFGKENAIKQGKVLFKPYDVGSEFMSVDGKLGIDLAFRTLISEFS